MNNDKRSENKMEKTNYTIKPEQQQEQKEDQEIKAPKKKRKIIGVLVLSGVLFVGGGSFLRDMNYKSENPEKLLSSETIDKMDEEKVNLSLKGLTIEEYNQNTAKINEFCQVENVEQMAGELKENFINSLANAASIDPSTISIQTNQDQENPYSYILVQPAGKIQEKYVPQKGLKDIGSWKDMLKKDTRKMPGYFYSMLQHISEIENLAEEMKVENNVSLEEIQDKLLSAKKALVGFNEKLDITYDSATGFKAERKQEIVEDKEEKKQDEKVETQEEQQPTEEQEEK